jgi:hypothetical protein
MMETMRQICVRLLAAMLPAVVLTACGSGEPLRVTSVQLGRSVNADGTVASHTTTFAPRDTVYVSVTTAGVGSGTLGVRWKWGSRIVGEPKKPVSSREAVVTEFHLKSADGFAPGDYSVEIFLDGRPVETRTFRVEPPR